MYRNIVKPTLDFITSFVLIILFLPLMILVGIILYIDLGSPIYNLRREREGKNKKVFIMYKLRTRKANVEKNSINPKFTKVSKVIDKHRLNELPQLFNVLKGDMSIIGPRPFIPGDKLPDGKVSEKRYLLKPGITGLAQVNGGRSINHKQKLAYDIEYYDNLSFLLDCKIIYKTFLKLLNKSIDIKP